MKIFMKSFKYLIFSLLMFVFGIFYVDASCTSEELDALKLEADKIKITYKHMGVIEDEEGIYYNRFEVNVKNMSDDLYISLFDGTTVLIPIDGEITETFTNGTWNFEIYSNICEEKISEINVFIPTFNKYSLDPLCDGIDGEDFALCGKYYEYDVSYDSFKERVIYYRTIHNIDGDTQDDDLSYENNIFDIILNYFVEFKIYIIILLVLIMLVLAFIIIICRRKNRGVLE